MQRANGAAALRKIVPVLRSFFTRLRRGHACAKRRFPFWREVPELAQRGGKWHIDCTGDSRCDIAFNRGLPLGEVVFLVEQESATGEWCIKRDASVRASYASRAQAVIDARQLARFECELRERSAVVRVIDAGRRVTEDLVCTPTPAGSAAIRPGGARFLIR